MASIRERVSKSGEHTWAVLYRHGGKQPSRTFADAKSAEKFKQMVELLGPDRALAELYSDGRPAGITVDQLATAYLEWKRSRVTPRTIEQYERDVKNWVSPWLGHREAETLDEADVQKWVDHMAGKLSPKSVADRHMLLHSMYQYGKARSRRLVTHNPCQETEMPTRTKKPPKGTTVPEFRAILAGAGERNPDAADLILFLGETGWRFSEAIGLPAGAVEVTDDGVWVTVTQVFRLEGGRQVIAEDAAKSYAGFRRIRLLPDSAAAVRRRLVGLGPADLVFTNSRGRPWNQNTFLRETWPAATRRAGLYRGPYVSPTPHWLRHMHVAVLSAAGVPLQEIQRRIGHESITTTINVYGGMIGDISDDAIDRASALMSGRRTAPGIAPGGAVVTGEVVGTPVAEVAALDGPQAGRDAGDGHARLDLVDPVGDERPDSRD